jgi:hypothetical protein
MQIELIINQRLHEDPHRGTPCWWTGKQLHLSAVISPASTNKVCHHHITEQQPHDIASPVHLALTSCKGDLMQHSLPHPLPYYSLCGLDQHVSPQPDPCSESAVVCGTRPVQKVKSRHNPFSNTNSL